MSLSKKLAQRTKIVEQLTKLDAEIAELRANSIDLTRVVSGAVVTFEYGRGEGKQVLTGTVLGRKAAEKGAELVRLSTGEGFDAQTVTTFIVNIKSVVSSPVAADEPAAEQA